MRQTTEEWLDERAHVNAVLVHTMERVQSVVSACSCRPKVRYPSAKDDPIYREAYAEYLDPLLPPGFAGQELVIRIANNFLMYLIEKQYERLADDEETK